MFVPDLKKFAQGVPEISREWDGREVTVTLTFDHRNLISSSLSPRRCLCQIRRNSLQPFLIYHVHEDGPDGTDVCTDGRTDKSKT